MLYAPAYSLCSALSLCGQPPSPAYSVFITPTSFLGLLETYDCSVLPAFRGTMTSADFSQFVVTMLRFAEGLLLRTCETSPGKNNDLRLIYLPHLRRKVRAVSDFVLSGKLVRLTLPSMRFLFVRPRLCPQRYFQTSESGFLQIPPHNGHPCLWLTVPTAKSVADFHRQVVAHAGRTSEKNPFCLAERIFRMDQNASADERGQIFIATS